MTRKRSCSTGNLKMKQKFAGKNIFVGKSSEFFSKKFSSKIFSGEPRSAEYLQEAFFGRKALCIYEKSNGTFWFRKKSLRDTLVNLQAK